MSSWVWVIICILVGGVGCHIILTKSDRTIIYEPDESSYKPTPIPLTPTVQVFVRFMKFAIQLSYNYDLVYKGITNFFDNLNS